ncbi:MAG: hypothetical protein PHX05_10030, partial [Acidobacteriota bacterium]|nr:hypothetical protein [Acidobacteriota bacterium]
MKWLLAGVYFNTVPAGRQSQRGPESPAIAGKGLHLPPDLCYNAFSRGNQVKTHLLIPPSGYIAQRWKE